MESKSALRRSTGNGRIKRTAEWWAQQKEHTGRRTSGRIVKQTTPSLESSKVQLQIRQGSKPTVLHIVKTKLPPGAKRVVNNAKHAQENHKSRQLTATIEKPKNSAVNGKSVHHKSPMNNNIKANFDVLISNLALDVTKEQLEDHFRKTGGIKSIKIPKEKDVDIGKGIAYIEFKNRISHGIALRLHHTTMGGKQISVEFVQNTKSKKSK